MNRLEFRLTREALGLRREDLAAAWKVSKRTVERWESGEDFLSETRGEQMASLRDAFEALLVRYAAAIDDLAAKLGHTRARLVVYTSEHDWLEFAEREPALLTAAMHRCFVYQLSQLVEPKFEFIAFDANNYVQWLGSWQDSAKSRSAWAAQL